MKIFGKLLLLLVSGLSLSCGASSPQDLSPREFNDRMATDSTAVVVDVRTPEEYASAHLPGAINLDFRNQPQFDAGCRDLDTSKTYYVYCRSGRRSAEACDRMMSYGLSVYNMCGGIQAWEKSGLPVLK